jgi:peptidoglycan/LPS O-acetylase OafA/YrhL
MQQLAFLAGASTPWLNTAAATAMTLACAAASWFLIERPALNFKKRRATRGASSERSPAPIGEDPEPSATQERSH